MLITTLRSIWKVIQEELPRDEWIPIQDIYALVEKSVVLQADDFLPAAPGSGDLKWRRNVRNVLQRHKAQGQIAWDRDGKYMIQSDRFEILDDGVAVVAKRGKWRARQLSAEAFKKILEARERTGVLGEEWVVNYEVKRLCDAGRNRLASQVRRISTENVAAGFDVISFDPDGSDRLIEVKTSVLSKLIFQITAHELDVAKQYGHQYWLYFVYEIRGNPGLVTIRNPARQVGTKLDLKPLAYQAVIR